MSYEIEVNTNKLYCRVHWTGGECPFFDWGSEQCNLLGHINPNEFSQCSLENCCLLSKDGTVVVKGVAK